MSDDSTWSEKGKKSGGAKRPPKAPAEPTIETTAPSDTTSRPSRRSEIQDDVGESNAGGSGSVVRRPSGEAGSRKVAQAAATAGQREASFQSRLGFPALVALVCLVGLITVFFAWNSREALATPSQSDHWHAVYGVYDCTQPLPDKYLPSFQSQQDLTGIHSHGDGVIHIHPFLEASSGPRAIINHFFDEMQVTVTDTSFTLDTGRTINNGDECADGSGAGEWKMLHWEWDFQVTGENPQDPEVIASDFNNVKFDHDREVFVMAFVSPDTPISDIPGPPLERFTTLNNVSSAVEWYPTDDEGNLIGRDTGVSVTGETEDGTVIEGSDADDGADAEGSESDE